MSSDVAIGALVDSLRELHSCLRVSLASGEKDDARLAADARDRWVRLAMHNFAETTFALLDTQAGTMFYRIVHEPRFLDAVQQLPPPSAAIEEAFANLDRTDARRLFAGLFLRLPYDLEGLTHFVRNERYDLVLLCYASWQPRCFERDEQRAAYVAYTTALAEVLADRLEVGTGPLSLFLEHNSRMIGSGLIYSCEGFLVDHAAAKARVIRAYLRRSHDLVPAEERQTEPLAPTATIRIGLLWADTERRTENFVGAASVEHLRDHGYHVTSIIHRARPPSKGRATMDARIAALSDEVLDLTQERTVPAQAAAIAGADLDALMFMTNVTHGYNDYIALAALRLARWQMVNLCAVVTTALPAIDIYVSGMLSEGAPDPQDGYRETLVRLPGSCLVFDRADGERDVSGSRRFAFSQLRDASTVTLFGSGANFYKLHPAVTETWARILAATPNSQLVLYPFNPNWDSAYAGSRFLSRFAAQLDAHGVAPSRVTVAGPWKDAEVIPELLAEIDIYLDSFPHSGGLSSLDALRLNIPVVTRGGLTQRENQTADLLKLMGLDEYVADSVESYVDMARRLAVDLSSWATFKVKLARGLRDASFFDTSTYSAHLATALRAAMTGQEVVA